MTPLCELARKYGTDKGGEHLQAGDTCHNYTPFYHELFHARRHQINSVLEIGVSHGCSLRMWADFFDRALVVGMDSDEQCLFNERRIRCFAGNQNSREDLENVVTAAGIAKYNLIVDDGSHEPEHQIFTATVLLPRLARGGYYIIEDIEPDCQPELISLPILDRLPHGYARFFKWQAISTGRGLGRAYCRCGCETGEQLIVLQHI
jgi:hypothetical protein